MIKKLSIIIPAYNEEKTIYKILDKVIDVDLGSISKEIIIVNDCSKDQTKEIIEKYIDNEGKEVSGLDIFDYSTVSEEGRLIGNVIIENQLGLTPKTIVGFENHGGRTYSNYKPLGLVKSGYGNNGKDKKEGIVYKNCIGTYLHGPILPKNPHLADYLILKALQRKYEVERLQSLNDDFENLAHKKVIKLYCK